MQGHIHIQDIECRHLHHCYTQPAWVRVPLPYYTVLGSRQSFIVCKIPPSGTGRCLHVFCQTGIFHVALLHYLLTEALRTPGIGTSHRISSLCHGSLHLSKLGFRGATDGVTIVLPAQMEAACPGDLFGVHDSLDPLTSTTDFSSTDTLVRSSLIAIPWDKLASTHHTSWPPYPGCLQP